MQDHCLNGVILRQAYFNTALPLECGQLLTSFELSYETYGRLNADGSNAILICHNLTANAHAAGRHHPQDHRPGWWDAAIGPGKPFDTDRFFVVCSNVLGGCGGSTGPASLDPHTGRPYGMRFPVVTIKDMVTAQARLADYLGIACFHTIAGGCVGGFQVLQWLALYPRRLARAIVIGATPRTSAHNLALWEVLRQAIIRDPQWQGGDYYDSAPPLSGYNLANMMGMLIWMSRDIMTRRFGLRLAEEKPPSFTFDPEFAMQAFLQKIGNNDKIQFDPNSLLYLTRATDYFNLTRDGADLSEVLAAAQARTLLVSYRSDWRYPPEEMEEIRQALDKLHVSVEHHTLDSDFGHGAFIYDVLGVGELIRTFLNQSEE